MLHSSHQSVPVPSLRQVRLFIHQTVANTTTPRFFVIATVRWTETFLIRMKEEIIGFKIKNLKIHGLNYGASETIRTWTVHKLIRQSIVYHVQNIPEYCIFLENWRFWNFEAPQVILEREKQFFGPIDAVREEISRNLHFTLPSPPEPPTPPTPPPEFG